MQARGLRVQANGWRLGTLLGRLLEAASGFKPSPGELLESSWRLTEPSWRLLESLGGVVGGLRGVLGGAGTEMGLRRGVLEAPRVVLEPSGDLWKPCWSHLEAKRVPT